MYQDWVVPTLIDLSMRNKRLRPYRERVAGAAEGRVLDVGIGSGVNLPLYGQAHEVFGLDPSSRLLARAHGQAQHTRVPVHLLEGSAESIPLADHSMDTVVINVDRLQHSRYLCRPPRNATRPQLRRASAVRGAWARSGAWRGALAGASRSALAALLGGMPLEPKDR
jgi:SAM-dependent methyltransferase